MKNADNNGDKIHKMLIFAIVQIAP